MSNENSYQGKHTFSYKSIYDHFRCLLKYWKRWIKYVIAIFTTLLAIIEAPVLFLKYDHPGWIIFIAIIAASLFYASLNILYVYIKSFPEGLENESKEVKKIAQIQRPKWEYRLAHILLKEKLTALENEYMDVVKDRIYIPTKTFDNIKAYFDWLSSRPVNLIRMLNVAVKLVIKEFTAEIQSTPDKPASPKSIVDITNKIQSLYTQAIMFERESRSIEPPGQFKLAHEMQFDWTSPIRDGIQQVLLFLEKVISLDPDGDHSINFTIEFNPPVNVDEFIEELDRIRINDADILDI